MTTRVTKSEGETVAAGREFARRLSPGAVVLITGPLGAGKTAFVRGLAEGLGCDGDDVSSPTFTIVQEYRGRLTVQHVDLYRLSPAEVDDLGLDDLSSGGAVVAVEWPDRWRDAPTQAWSVRLAMTGDSERTIEIAEPHSTR